MSDNTDSLKKILLLIQQFTPFMLIWYFILYSIFNNTLSGITMVFGMIFTSFFTMFIGNSIFSQPDIKNSMLSCNFISIKNITGISSIPFSQSIYGFTFAYLLYTILSYNQLFTNIFPLICFLTLIISDIVWLTTNRCFPPINIIFATGFSIILGILWGYTIRLSPNQSMQYTVGMPDNICVLPKTRTYKCNSKPKSE